MNGEDEVKEGKNGDLPAAVGRKARRRIKARRDSDRSVWFGIGMFGMVGWTVAITTVIGLVIGLWMDRAWPGPFSWTLTMFIIGLTVGCMNAWYWVMREGRLDDGDDDD